MPVEYGEIEILSREVIDQIAAGEVVERPASVVKELVENAVDAGAKTISIEVERGGKDRICVVDDGAGMTRAEALLAVRRHATSKLRKIDDLFGIATMGFRGEALASIAAVARLRMVTRKGEGGQPAGTELVLCGGVVESVADIGAPVGTTVEVTKLLANVPARQKFLKGDATESAHVGDVVAKLALAYPSVHFRLRHGARMTLAAPSSQDGLERARLVLGNRGGNNLYPVVGFEHGIEVRGYLAAPELAQSTSRGLQLFVGRRAVKDRGLVHAVVMGYRELLPKGRYPMAVVFVEVPAAEVDVNVHPQKSEVRFSDAQRVYGAVRHTIARAVAGAPWLQGKESGNASGLPLQVWQGRESTTASRASELAVDYAVRHGAQPFRVERSPDSSLRESSWHRLGQVALPVTSPTRARADSPALEYAEASLAGRAAQAIQAENSATEKEGFFGHLDYLGQLDATYLVCTNDQELVLIDQHAAHERVRFHELRARADKAEQANEGGAVQQPLLFPEVIDASQAELAALAECSAHLERVGYVAKAHGEERIEVSCVPTNIGHADPMKLLRTVLGEVGCRSASRADEACRDLVLATMACHSSVRAGDVLDAREVSSLFAALDTVDFRGYCPHGRPVIARMGVSEIARRFGRT